MPEIIEESPSSVIHVYSRLEGKIEPQMRIGKEQDSYTIPRRHRRSCPLALWE
ncbi:MAG: hypothetical protein Q7O66_12400 [Dehalococcoidia bacterium]|nr:hypothetical protein [Dehalococcoidia bacterium]